MINADPSITGWRTSSYSNGSGGQCVEVGCGDALIGVRDTKDRANGPLLFSKKSWSAFLTDMTAGRFDR